MLKVQPTPLTHIEMALYAAGYEVVYFSPESEPDLPCERLNVVLLRDQHGQEYDVELLFVNDIVEIASRKANVELRPSSTYTLQFTVILPFEVQPEHLSDLACLTTALNRAVTYGALGVNQADGVYFRYSLVHESKSVDLKVVVELLDSIAAILSGMIPIVQTYLSGAYPLADLLAQWQGITANEKADEP